MLPGPLYRALVDFWALSVVFLAACFMPSRASSAVSPMLRAASWAALPRSLAVSLAFSPAFFRSSPALSRLDFAWPRLPS